MSGKRLWIVEGVLALAGLAALAAALTMGRTPESETLSSVQEAGQARQVPSVNAVTATGEAGPEAPMASHANSGDGIPEADLRRYQPWQGSSGAAQREGASVTGTPPGRADRRQADGMPGAPADEPEAPLAEHDPPEIAQKLLARIADATGGKLDEQDIQALAALRDSDIDVAGLLKKEYFAPASGKAVDVVRNSVILKAMESLGTPQAKQALLDIACTEQPNAQTLGPRAVQALAEITQDADEIAFALRAPHPATRDAAAQALAGRALSAGSIDALVAQMTSSSWITQNLVGTAFATDKSPAGAARKIAAILENYPKLRGRVDDKQSVPNGVCWTPTELARSSYAASLSQMQGGEQELQRRITNASDAQREPLLLALGRRGAGNIRPELLKMARGAEEGFVRTMAVNSLYYIATDEDKALLRQLAENDPFERTVIGGRAGERKVFPVRDAARQVLERLEKD